MRNHVQLFIIFIFICENIGSWMKFAHPHAHDAVVANNGIEVRCRVLSHVNKRRYLLVITARGRDRSDEILSHLVLR